MAKIELYQQANHIQEQKIIPRYCSFKDKSHFLEVLAMHKSCNPREGHIAVITLLRHCNVL